MMFWRLYELESTFKDTVESFEIDQKYCLLPSELKLGLKKTKVD